MLVLSSKETTPVKEEINLAGIDLSYILEPDKEEFERAITMDELLMQLKSDIHTMFTNP